MTFDVTVKPTIRSAARQRLRRGTGMLDLFVSFTLLVTLISVVTPLVVRHGHLLRSHRDYRLALDELSNQMERLTGLRTDQLPGAVKQLKPSAFLAERLSGAELVGELEPAEIGSRVTLKLTWNETGRRNAPVSLAAWVIPAPQPLASESEGAQP
jgi:hypothetical protein